MATPLRQTLLAGLLGIVLGASPALRPAKAAIIDITATGVVDDITIALLVPPFAIGQDMSLTMRFDTSTAPDSSLGATQTKYENAILGVSFAVGGYSGTILGGTINVSDNDPVVADSVSFRGVTDAPALSSYPVGSRGMLLEFSDVLAATLSDRALPASTADLIAFPASRWFLSFGSSLGGAPAPGVGGSFRLLELTVRESVPEPGALLLSALLLAALVLFGGSRREQRAHRRIVLRVRRRR